MFSEGRKLTGSLRLITKVRKRKMKGRRKRKQKKHPKNILSENLGHTTVL
jgi:hypothetical protein